MSDQTPMGQRIAWVFLALFLSGLMGFAIYSRLQNTSASLPVIGRVTGFSFQDHRGKTLSASDLKGSPWIADFIFTRCAGTCNVMTSAMAALNKRIPENSSVKLVSFSMDPEHDTPKVLAEYAKTMGAEHPRWYFLTGKRDDMYKLTRDQFMQVVTDEGGTPEEPIVHSTRFVLVDKRGRIRGLYSGQEKEGVEQLLEDLKALEKER